MFCSKCGEEINGIGNFCAVCGTPVDSSVEIQQLGEQDFETSQVNNTVQKSSVKVPNKTKWILGAVGLLIVILVIVLRSGGGLKGSWEALDKSDGLYGITFKSGQIIMLINSEEEGVYAESPVLIEGEDYTMGDGYIKLEEGMAFYNIEGNILEMTQDGEVFRFKRVK